MQTYVQEPYTQTILDKILKKNCSSHFSFYWQNISTSSYTANINWEIYNYLLVKESTKDSYTNVRSRTVTYGTQTILDKILKKSCSSHFSVYWQNISTSSYTANINWEIYNYLLVKESIKRIILLKNRNVRQRQRTLAYHNY